MNESIRITIRIKQILKFKITSGLFPVWMCLIFFVFRKKCHSMSAITHKIANTIWKYILTLRKAIWKRKKRGTRATGPFHFEGSSIIYKYTPSKYNETKRRRFKCSGEDSITLYYIILLQLM